MHIYNVIEDNDGNVMVYPKSNEWFAESAFKRIFKYYAEEIGEKTDDDFHDADAAYKEGMATFYEGDVRIWVERSVLDEGEGDQASVFAYPKTLAGVKINIRDAYQGDKSIDPVNLINIDELLDSMEACLESQHLNNIDDEGEYYLQECLAQWIVIHKPELKQNFDLDYKRWE